MRDKAASPSARVRAAELFQRPWKSPLERPQIVNGRRATATAFAPLVSNPVHQTIVHIFLARTWRSCAPYRALPIFLPVLSVASFFEP
jgi:hypothetical protein